VKTVLFGVLLSLAGCAARPHVTGDRPWYFHRQRVVTDGRVETEIYLCDRPLPDARAECYELHRGSRPVGGRRGKPVEPDIVEDVQP
jgi:hypothetical protein